LYNRRTAAAYRFVKEQVGSGEIGRLLRATWLATFHFRGDAYYRSGTWRGTWELEGGGLLMTQAAHQLDLLQWICGSPEVVTACCRTVDRKIETENEATLLLRFPSGATGHFIASGHEMPGVNRLELAGTKGHIILEDDRFFTLRRLVTDSVDFSRESSDPFGKAGNTVYNREFPPEDDAAQHAATLQNFADAVLYGAELVCPLEEGAASLKIILEAYRNTIPAKSW
ncbi:MAG: Gfo/Idh/MocA family oxidoreductase, partial [Oscillospiraceae bacterium]|nr:Gfo/Idh/MocA family oxidoreductase [Oscillospiraceae bacterium]